MCETDLQARYCGGVPRTESQQQRGKLCLASSVGWDGHVLLVWHVLEGSVGTHAGGEGVYSISVRFPKTVALWDS
jgi:hypothetical protein